MEARHLDWLFAAWLAQGKILQARSTGKCHFTHANSILRDRKSQIAREFAESLSSTHSVIWVNCNNEATLIDSLRTLIFALDPDNSVPDKIDDLMLTAKTLLEDSSCHQWCMVLDGLDDVDLLLNNSRGAESLAKLLPKTRRGKIVFTSQDLSIIGRDNGMLVPITNGIQVSTMNDEQSTRLLHSALPSDLLAELGIEGPQSFEELSGELSGLPLALVQAAAYMSHTRIGPDAYLEQYLARRNRFTIFLPDSTQTSVFKTFELSYDRIAIEDGTNIGSASARLLNFLSVFDNSEIPENQVQGIFKDNIGEAEQFPAAMGRLLNFNLVKRSGQHGSYYWIHPMVHRWIFDRLIDQEREDLVCRAVRSFHDMFLGEKDYLNMIQSSMETLVRLAASSLPHGVNILDLALDEGWSDVPYIRELSFQVGVFASVLGLDSVASTCIRWALYRIPLHHKRLHFWRFWWITFCGKSSSTLDLLLECMVLHEAVGPSLRGTTSALLLPPLNAMMEAISRTIEISDIILKSPEQHNKNLNTRDHLKKISQSEQSENALPSAVDQDLQAQDKMPQAPDTRPIKETDEVFGELSKNKDQNAQQILGQNLWGSLTTTQAEATNQLTKRDEGTRAQKLLYGFIMKSIDQLGMGTMVENPASAFLESHSSQAHEDEAFEIAIKWLEEHDLFSSLSDDAKRAYIRWLWDKSSRLGDPILKRNQAKRLCEVVIDVFDPKDSTLPWIFCHYLTTTRALRVSDASRTSFLVYREIDKVVDLVLRNEPSRTYRSTCPEWAKLHQAYAAILDDQHLFFDAERHTESSLEIGKLFIGRHPDITIGFLEVSAYMLYIQRSRHGDVKRARMLEQEFPGLDYWVQKYGDAEHWICPDYYDVVREAEMMALASNVDDDNIPSKPWEYEDRAIPMLEALDDEVEENRKVRHSSTV